MSFYYLSIYLPCNILLQQLNQRKRTTAIQLVLENKELLRLFCSSCKSVQQKGQSCQLFPLEVFCGSSTVHRRHTHHLSIGKKRSPQSMTQLCFQRWTPPSATMRAYLNEKCLPTLPQLRLLRNNCKKGFLRGGRSSDPVPGTWAEKWNLGPNPKRMYRSKMLHSPRGLVWPVSLCLLSLPSTCIYPIKKHRK